MTPRTTRLLTAAELAERLGINPETIRRWRRDGRGPAYITDGQGFYRYREADVDAWENAKRVTTAA